MKNLTENSILLSNKFFTNFNKDPKILNFNLCLDN